MAMDDDWSTTAAIFNPGVYAPKQTVDTSTMSTQAGSLGNLFGGDWSGKQGVVGDIFGDGKQWTLQQQSGDPNAKWVLWADHGKINKNFDANGNYLNSYVGSGTSPWTLGEVAEIAAKGLSGMALGPLLAAGAAGAGAAGGGLGGGLSGIGGSILEGGGTALGGGLGSSLAGLSGLSPAAAAAVGGGSLLSNPIISKALGSVGGSALSGILGGGGGGGGSGGGSLGSLIAGLYDKNKQNQAADNLLNYMNTQQKKIDDIYDPNGERAKYLWEEMSRKDAAAGRNSQYGPRTADFLGKFGGEYANATANMARGLAGNYGAAYNQQASSGAGLSAALGNMLNGGSIGGMTLKDLISKLSTGTATTNLGSVVGDYGQSQLNDFNDSFPVSYDDSIFDGYL
jgi:hypothetical protein